MKPTPDQYPEYYGTYISKVEQDDFLKALKKGSKRTMKFLKQLTAEEWKFKYAEGKWTPKEILVHMMDSERVFVYRALRFARKDATELPGYDHDAYVPQSGASQRSVKSLLKEYKNLRRDTLCFFENLEESSLDLSGKANGNSITVRSLGFIVAGHEIHHLGVIKEKYLVSKK